jgi:hypothetical protein
VPSKDPIQRFEDILENIVLIEEFTLPISEIAEEARPIGDRPAGCLRPTRPTCSGLLVLASFETSLEAAGTSARATTD